MSQRRSGRWLACAILFAFFTARTAAAPLIPVVVDAPVAAPVKRALADLEQALQRQGFESARRDSLDGNETFAVVVGDASSSATVTRLLSEKRIALPKQAEALCIQRLHVGTQRVLLIAGNDSRGLSYALLEVARAIEVSAADRDPLAVVSEALEAPFLRVRSMTMHPLNADLDAEWYFDEGFWRDYFTQLALHRYNNFSLTFCDQTNYLNPVYAYLVDLPEFPQVRIQGLSADERLRNLSMLRRIAEMAAERGLDFTLGIWMQAPVPNYAGQVLVENLPEGLKAADYCAAGLKQVLQACPAISGVQFRMNAEAGVSEENQTVFYQPLFKSVRECGRPMRLDLRYKGLQPATTKAAVDAGLDVTVSTKFWCEHFGLPYHPTVSDRLYRKDRYSFGAMLEKPRPYHVVYQLWTVGSQRLLLWGDPEYAAQFARSCRLGDGEGFEVFAPLTNKGYGNEPGRWRIFANKSDEHFTWEQDRYWFFSLCFGRLGYDPNCNPEVWRREFRHRFGDAATEIEAAYRQASRILPLITAAHLPSASEWRWWPEMDTGGALTEYIHTPPSDTGQFYGIRSWKSTPRWGGDPWDETIPGFVDDSVAGRLRGKTTPVEVSQKLLDVAVDTERSLAAAASKTCGAASAEQRATERDLRILAQLARYHSAKILAAKEVAFFEVTNQGVRLLIALKHARSAEKAWRQIVTLTDGVYHDNLVFGIARGSPRSKLGQHHSGHWKDRLPEVCEDVAGIERLLKQHAMNSTSFRILPGEIPPADELKIEHVPIETAKAGSDVQVAARVRSAMPPRQVILHYRPLDQTADWKELPMSRDGDGRFQATIPGRELSERWDMQYYLEILIHSGAGRLWPSWEHGPPYVVMKVTR